MMWKRVVLVFLLCLMTGQAYAQAAALNKAKYVTILKVVADHKMEDKELQPDVNQLRESDRFQQDLRKMLAKLDNSRPSEAKNRRVMRILERTGKEIYDLLK